MRQFMHGKEWWGLHDDGTWVRWNNQTMDWDSINSVVVRVYKHAIMKRARLARITGR